MYNRIKSETKVPNLLYTVSLGGHQIERSVIISILCGLKGLKSWHIHGSCCTLLSEGNVVKTTRDAQRM